MWRKGYRPILKIISENGPHIFVYKVVNLGYIIVLHGKNKIQMFYFNDIKPFYIHFHTWQINVHIPCS